MERSGLKRFLINSDLGIQDQDQESVFAIQPDTVSMIVKVELDWSWDLKPWAWDNNCVIITHTNVVTGVGRLSALHNIVNVGTLKQKPPDMSSRAWQADSTWKVLVTHFIWGQKVKYQGWHKFALFWVLVL